MISSLWKAIKALCDLWIEQYDYRESLKFVKNLSDEQLSQLFKNSTGAMKQAALTELSLRDNVNYLYPDQELDGI